ncbi:MAG: NAD(+) synthase, partial [Oscillospiraceae bacterium]
MIDGFIKCAAATPEIRVADCDYNTKNIIELIDRAKTGRVKILAFPELCVTGYTCGDLFFQSTLISAAKSALADILAASKASDMIVAVGCPLDFFGKLYNCAVVLQSGKILGVIPKKFLPNYNEFYEKRWFSCAPEGKTSVTLLGQEVPFGTGLTFQCAEMPELCFSAEVCEDLWSPNPPSTEAALSGATIIANLSASNEQVGKDEYRMSLVTGQSARLICGYIFSSAGKGESTTDLVFGGHRIIAENGKIQSESGLYTTGLTITEIDVKAMHGERLHNTTFCNRQTAADVVFQMAVEDTPLTRKIEAAPFVPQVETEKNSRCRKILAMQAHGLAKRVKHTNSKTMVVGISGGLDSCLALLVCVEAAQILSRPLTDIIAVTMPCFGTTKRTKSNAETLCNILGVTLRTIDITDTVRSHLRDISHDESVMNAAYENAQARERTQVLMDIANDENGLVIGTGDLSELALGWATYNGDHISMYGVNGSVPKTLVRHIVKYYAETTDNPALSEVLLAIFNTPVSPELLPAKDGEISQITEDLVGPYELHDFFLYYAIRWGFSPKKVYRLAKYAFNGSYENEV